MVRKNPNRDEWKMPLELVFLGQSREQPQLLSPPNHLRCWGSLSLLNQPGPAGCFLLIGRGVSHTLFSKKMNPQRLLSLIKRLIISRIILVMTRMLWGWGLTWVGTLLVFFENFLDFLMSFMDLAPIGGSGSGAGPSHRPRIDLNLPPEPEEEPVTSFVPSWLRLPT